MAIYCFNSFELVKANILNQLKFDFIELAF